jgi:hypothetical protein
MKSHSWAAVVSLFLFASVASADAGLPRPSYVAGASDTQVYAQNFIVLGLILAGIPTAVGLMVARWTPRWGFRIGAIILAVGAGFVLLVLGFFAGIFITNEEPYNRRFRPQPPPPSQPTEQTGIPAPE